VTRDSSDDLDDRGERQANRDFLGVRFRRSREPGTGGGDQRLAKRMSRGRLAILRR